MPCAILNPPPRYLLFATLTAATACLPVAAQSLPPLIRPDRARPTPRPRSRDPSCSPAQRPRSSNGPATEPYDKTFDDLRFEMASSEPFRREMLTEPINALAGQHIRIRGFILPTPQKRGIKQFVLVRDNQECCFGPGAALFDCILVEMQPGRDGRVHDPAGGRVRHVRHPEFVGPDGRHLAIYHLDGEAVK